MVLEVLEVVLEGFVTGVYSTGIHRAAVDNIRPPGAGYRELEYIEGAFPSPKLDAKTKNRPNHQNWMPKPKKTIIK